jgi:hypothetical protein
MNQLNLQKIHDFSYIYERYRKAISTQFPYGVDMIISDYIYNDIYYSFVIQINGINEYVRPTHIGTLACMLNTIVVKQENRIKHMIMVCTCLSYGPSKSDIYNHPTFLNTYKTKLFEFMFEDGIKNNDLYVPAWIESLYLMFGNNGKSRLKRFNKNVIKEYDNEERFRKLLVAKRRRLK